MIIYNKKKGGGVNAPPLSSLLKNIDPRLLLGNFLENAVVLATGRIVVVCPKRIAVIFEDTCPRPGFATKPGHLVGLDFCTFVWPCFPRISSVGTLGDTICINFKNLQAHFAVIAIFPATYPSPKKGGAVGRNICRYIRLTCVTRVCRQLRLCKRSADENEEQGDQSKNSFFEDLHGTLL